MRLFPAAFMLLVLFPAPNGLSPAEHYLGTALAALCVGGVAVFRVTISTAEVLWGLLIIVWILGAALLNHDVVTGSDLLRELVKYTSIILMLLTVRNFFNYQKDGVFILKFMSFYVILVSLFFIPFVDEFLLKVYDFDKNSVGLNPLEQRVRVTGTFENPNYLAFFLCMATCALLHCKVQPSFIRNTVLGALALLIVMTGSRTGFLSTIFIYGWFVFSSKRDLRGKLILVAFAALFFIPLALSISRFALLLDYGALIASESVNTRILVLNEALTLIKISPLLGYFESPIPVTDNYFTLITLRYGIFFVPYLLFFAYRSSKDRSLADSSQGIFNFLGFTLIFLNAGAFLDNPRLSIIWILFLQFFLGSSGSKKSIENG